jgi:4-hydroxy-4-methyl-2-oxoglutarate aldolase
MTTTRAIPAATLAILWFAQGAWAQVFTLTREQMVKYTAQNPYERFADGRPKVPDAMLERVKGLSAEEVLGIERRGFTNQFVKGFQLNRPGMKLVGRAFTLMLMPYRPDIEAADAAERKAKGLDGLRHQTAMDMLQPGDVFVADMFGDEDAGLVGDNLALYIWKTTGNGFVFDGAIRDLEGIATLDMAAYFRGATPASATGTQRITVTGINVPVRIGKTTVMPGDVVFGDREGVYFIPPQLVKEIVDTADITHIHDEWTRMKFEERKYKSTDVYSSPRDPALKKEYEEFLKQKLGAKRYEEYQKERQGQQR